MTAETTSQTTAASTVAASALAADAGLPWRVVAGPNLGACLILAPGRLVCGAGDEADVVLSDDSVQPAHLELELSRGAEWTVRARPLGGEVRLDGAALPPEGAEVKPDQVLSLGFSALTWRLPGQAWTGADLRTYAAALGLLAAESELGAAARPARDSSPVDVAGPVSAELPGEIPDASPADVGRESKPDRRPTRRRSNRAGFLLIALLLALMVVWLPGEEDGQALDAFRRLLDANGYESLTVVPRGRGLEAAGTLESDEELGRLVELVKGRPETVFLRISIKRDVLEAARQSLGAYGFFPDLTYDADGQPKVAVYMLDQEVETQAFEALARDVPAFEPRRAVVRGDVLAPALREELARASLTDLEIVCLEGFVELRAPDGFRERAALSDAVRRTAGRLGVPVVYALRAQVAEGAPDAQGIQGGLAGLSEPPVQTTVFEGWAASSAAPAEAGQTADPDDPLSSLEVVGVTLSPIRFVSAKDGHKLFEGSPLPGGWTISVIEDDSLLLTRGTEERRVELGGSGLAGVGALEPAP
jgi:type III secretion system YscD/HrpQ family protein